MPLFCRLPEVRRFAVTVRVLDALRRVPLPEAQCPTTIPIFPPRYGV
jgi:hypothetical protein